MTNTCHILKYYDDIFIQTRRLALTLQIYFSTRLIKLVIIPSYFVCLNIIQQSAICITPTCITLERCSLL